MRIYIVVENLQLGGYQRLALDQAYCFSKLGHSVSIISLSANESPADNLEVLEEDLIDRFRIKVEHCGGSRFKQFLKIQNFINRSVDKQPIIVHSLRASVIVTLIKIFSRRNLQVLTTIHQLPSLSAPMQRLKRFIYAQFCDELFAYSKAVKMDWDERLSRLFFMKKFLFPKNISVLRNGIFLDRLPDIAAGLDSNQIIPNRIVYLGRVTSWKGLNKFYSCVMLPELSESPILMMIPSVSSNSVKGYMNPNAFERTTVISGKTILDYSPNRNDIHLYPVEYPRSATYIESISLNCLEMACLGVRSLVTTGGLGTWPDIVQSNVFIEVDWNQLEIEIGQKLDSCRSGLTDIEIAQVRSKIDIQNQIDSYLKFFEL